MMAQPKTDKEIAYAVMGGHAKSILDELPGISTLRKLSGTTLTEGRVKAIQERVKELAEKRVEFYQGYLAKKDIEI